MHEKLQVSPTTLVKRRSIKTKAGFQSGGDVPASCWFPLYVLNWDSKWAQKKTSTSGDECENKHCTYTSTLTSRGTYGRFWTSTRINTADEELMLFTPPVVKVSWWRLPTLSIICINDLLKQTFLRCRFHSSRTARLPTPAHSHTADLPGLHSTSDSDACCSESPWERSHIVYSLLFVTIFLLVGFIFFVTFIFGGFVL